MDQYENTISGTVSDVRLISTSPVTVTVEAAPAVVEEEITGGDPLAKRKRGRPRQVIKPGEPLRKSRGAASKSLGGGDFTAHIVTVNPGEDIIERIMSFTQNGSRGICVLSANGAVSNVKIQPPGLNEPVLTFEDAYEILSLSGSTVITESEGVRIEKRGWRISIGGVNGCFVGGSLAGRLIAASPVQVVIGTFWQSTANPPRKRNYKSKSVVVTQTKPNTLASTSSGQVQQPEMRDPSTI